MAQPDIIKLGLFYLFDKPGEPLFTPKADGRIKYIIPPEYMCKWRGREWKTQASPEPPNRRVHNIPVKKLDRLPDVSVPMRLKQDGMFSLFLHRDLAAALIGILMGVRHLEDFFSVAVYCRLRLNPHLMNYGLSVAMAHRPDTTRIKIPSLGLTFPQNFVPREYILEAAMRSISESDPVEIRVDYTANDLDFEHRLAYFREDPGVNLHHWHWHIIYPGDGPDAVVNKDRRGELFYYMHQQLMARYNTERLCNDLARAKRLQNLNQPIEEAYFPKMNAVLSAKNWGSRMANSLLKDVHRPDENKEQGGTDVDVADITRWTYLLKDTIQTGRAVTPSGERVPLTIDMLGNMVESTILSPNTALYGNLHNMGHMAIAYCHDPEDKYRESFGVMADTSTAIRDPVFFRWHSFINDVFVQYKNTLPPYTEQELEYLGVEVSLVRVLGGDVPNVLRTSWAKDDIDISMGLNFSMGGPAYVRYTHLAHEPFSYEISVENTLSSSCVGTCRIFIAPKFDDRRKPLLLNDQRHLFIELDKFTVKLMPGINFIERKSSDSSVTIPLKQIFGNTSPEDATESNYCGCGWPDYMLLPKGTYRGYPCQLFVMISNYRDDQVDDAEEADDRDECKSCKQAPSYCGLRNKLYPDKRAMGFPMDRRFEVNTLDEFRNMHVTDVVIKFIDS